MNIEQADAIIALLRRQVAEANERIATLTAEVRRLQAELVAAQAQREDFAAKVYHATRRGW